MKRWSANTISCRHSWDYLGLPDPNDDMSPGRSFVSALSGETNDAKDEIVVFDEYGPVRMIRTQEWKYVHRYPYGPHELYDLVNDPDERKNLIDEKSQTARIDDMRQQMGAWFQRYVLPEFRWREMLRHRWRTSRKNRGRTMW